VAVDSVVAPPRSPWRSDARISALAGAPGRAARELSARGARGGAERRSDRRPCRWRSACSSSARAVAKWVLDLTEERCACARARAEKTAFSYVQTVADWRGALWEGRGGAVGAAPRRCSVRARPRSRPRSGSSAGNPAAIEALGALRGLLHVVVSDRRREWRVGLQLGPARSRPSRHRAVRVRGRCGRDARGRPQADRGVHGGRHPRARRHGLVFQMQAAQMQAAADSRAAPAQR
jgi:hypothetical protein